MRGASLIKHRDNFTFTLPFVYVFAKLFGPRNRSPWKNNDAVSVSVTGCRLDNRDSTSGRVEIFLLAT